VHVGASTQNTKKSCTFTHGMVTCARTHPSTHPPHTPSLPPTHAHTHTRTHAPTNINRKHSKERESARARARERASERERERERERDLPTGECHPDTSIHAQDLCTALLPRGPLVHAHPTPIEIARWAALTARAFSCESHAHPGGKCGYPDATDRCTMQQQLAEPLTHTPTSLMAMHPSNGGL